MIYKKILVPYDQSKYADRALDEAVSIAKMTGGSEIIVLYVMEEIPTPTKLFETNVRHYKTREPTTLSIYLRDLQRDMRYDMVNKLEEVKKRYKNSVKIGTQVIFGSPADKIVEFANRHNVDLIVMGRRGLKGVRRFLLGSISRNVIERVNRSVMIVK
jgi:nucleotide-binding universal stress UspA family protein